MSKVAFKRKRRAERTEVFALRLGALAYTSRDAAFELVGRSHTAVPVLEVDGEADRVADAVAAPCRADAGLDGTETLAVSVAGLEASLREGWRGKSQLRILERKEGKDAQHRVPPR